MFLEEEIYFNSFDGGSEIYAKFWIAEKPKMLLQIAHGMVEHILRYEEFAKFLNNHGIVVFGNDHLGHGNTAKNEDDFGYFANEDGDKAIVENMYSLTKIAKEKYPDLPIFFLGHSMGSFLLRNYLFKYGQYIDGAIIMGTGNQNPSIIKTGIKLTNKIANAKGWNYRSKIIDKLAFGSFNKKFGKKDGKEWLSRDSKKVFEYTNDYKCNFIFTLNAYNNLFKIIDTLNKKENLEKMPKDLHILFMAGDKDPVGNFGKEVLNTYNKFKEFNMENTECKLYKDYRHEILNELDREVVFNDILNWLEKVYYLKSQKNACNENITVV